MDALNNGGTLHDLIMVSSIDGTGHQVDITINGANDVVLASLPSTFAGSGDPNDNDSAGPTTPNLTAGTGNAADTLVGTAAGETLDGKAGNDTIYGKGGDDTIVGGAGTDNLYGQAGNDGITDTAGTDTIYGGSGNDTIDAGANDDIVYGGSGNDSINAGAGADTIVGGYGADTINVGAADGMTDIVRYLSLNDTNDIISNFVSGQDKIDLSAIDANSNAGGNDTFAWGGQQASTSVQAYSVTWSTNGANVVILADTDGNVSSAEFQITLTGISSIVQTDFNTL